MNPKSSETGSASTFTRAASGSASASLEGKNFEHFLTEFSSALLQIATPDIGREFDRWIKKIVLDNNLDRAGLAQLDPKSGKLVVRHSFGRGNSVTMPLGMDLKQRAPHFVQTLMAGRTLIFSKVKELMPEFAGDFKTYQRYFPKSNVTVPLIINNATVGAIGIATLRSERSWSARDVRRIKLIADVFANTIERRRAEEENELLRGELAHLSRAAVMGELTASLTHQLNQPMAAILNNAEAIQNLLLSSHPDLNELHAAINDIVHDDLQASEIIKGLRAFFRKDRLRKAPLELKEVVSEVLRMVRSDALFKRVELTFDGPPSAVCVYADRIQLQQAIINLILNAFDAVSGVEGERLVSVGIAADDEQTRLTVRDSGKGLDPKTISRIFQPFFTTKTRGMGMGLSIARSIVKAHGGKLSAFANPDRGATFEILLPRKDAGTQVVSRAG